MLLVDPDLEARFAVAGALGEVGFDTLEEVARRTTSTPLAARATALIRDSFPPSRARAAFRGALGARNIEGAALAIAVEALASIDPDALLEGVFALASIDPDALLEGVFALADRRDADLAPAAGTIPKTCFAFSTRP